MPLTHSRTSPLLVLIRTCPCAASWVNCNRDPGPYRDSAGFGPKQFLMSPLKDCTSNSAAGAAANVKLKSPLTDSPSICPSGANASSVFISPDTLLNRPRLTSASSMMTSPSRAATRRGVSRLSAFYFLDHGLPRDARLQQRPAQT